MLPCCPLLQNNIFMTNQREQSGLLSFFPFLFSSLFGINNILLYEGKRDCFAEYICIVYLSRRSSDVCIQK